jgi:hypothetical protein
MKIVTWFALLGLAAGSLSAAEKTVSLFDGRDLTGWRQPTGEWLVARAVSLDPADPKKFVITPGTGILVNGPKAKTTDLTTEAEFGDAQIHVEFCVSKHSNSGIYLMGRYELQVLDSFGVAQGEYPGVECGGIYPRWINEQNVEGHSPLVNASKPPGEWQTFDITFRAPRFDASGKKIANAAFVKVLHNGKLIQENVELRGPTRGGVPAQEGPSGPIRLQGDHGPVAYRNLTLKPLKLE